MNFFEDCTDYKGAVYHDPVNDAMPFVSPERTVGLHTLVYVKGVGISYRVVSIPGSNQDAWYRETEGYVCKCAVPAMWHFTGIDGATVVTHDTLNVHEAVHLMAHPDHLFDGPDDNETGMRCNLALVPEELGMVGAVREFTGFLANHGVEGVSYEGEISYEEMVGFDPDELARQIFQGDGGNH